jgi:divalent metal cation (Fe/Co/Zn/Cd) transporter
MLHHIDLHVIVNGNISVRAGQDLAHILQDHLRQTIPIHGKVLIHIEPAE